MSDLTEAEIFDRLCSAIREAIEASNILATASRRGPPYERLRSSLALAEGACRQMAMWRLDSRWLTVGAVMHEVHSRAGGFLRGFTRDGVFIRWAPGHINEAFIKLSAQLAFSLETIERFASTRTGVIGPVLHHEAPPEERRFGRPALERRNVRRPGALILPPRYTKAG